MGLDAVSQPAPVVRTLGLRLLERELERTADSRRDAAVLADAAERATRKLGLPLSRLVGVEGYQALLKRALHLARVECPILEEVRIATDPAGSPSGLDGLDAVVQGVDPALARDALGAVLAHLVWLLVTFIGDDLALRTVREVWPEIQIDGEAAAAASEEATT